MGKFIFVIGGTRSGKSRYARDLAKGLSKRVAFIATCVPSDREMKKRVALHKKSRPRSWKTIEEPQNLRPVLNSVKNESDVVIIDCLGLCISNLLSTGLKERGVKKEVKLLACALAKTKVISIVVSNEVGGGLIPQNLLARQFTDLMGFANQIMAKRADDVIYIQSGIATKIKGGQKECKN